MISNKFRGFSERQVVELMSALAASSVKLPMDARAQYGTPTERAHLWRARAEALEVALNAQVTAANYVLKWVKRGKKIPLAKFGWIQ